MREVKSISKVKLFFIRALFITVLIFCGYKIITANAWFYPSDLFDYTRSQNIVISGNKITPKEEILKVLRTFEVPKVPAYLLNTKPYKEKISELETVKSVFIRRYWLPARLQIVVQDREPIIKIAIDENKPAFAFFVDGGKMLDISLLPKEYQELPLKVLVTSNSNFSEWTDKDLNFFMDLTKKFETYTGEDVLYIDYRQPHDIFVKTEKNLFRIGENNDTLDNRLEVIPSVISALNSKEQGKKVEYIDLRWNTVQFFKYKE